MSNFTLSRKLIKNHLNHLISIDRDFKLAHMKNILKFEFKKNENVFLLLRLIVY